jgi:hypothetical protein
LYAAEWDSSHSTEAFFEAYRKVIKAKWQHCQFGLQTAKMISGTGDNGFFVVWISGNVLSSVEGLKDEVEWQRLQTAAGA